MRELGRNTSIIFANSKAYMITNSDWLLGGMMEVINGKISSLIAKEIIKIDLIGKWLAYPVSNS